MCWEVECGEIPHLYPLEAFLFRESGVIKPSVPGSLEGVLINLPIMCFPVFAVTEE